VRPTLGETWRQYSGYARGDAIAGMYASRHAIRFATYGAALALLLSRRRISEVLLLAGAAAYAFRPLKRAFSSLRGRPAGRAAALVGVPAMMAFTDLAKMCGYVAGLRERPSVRRPNQS